jgi:hypothetical protein
MFVWTNSAELWIDLSTCDSAAKLMTASTSEIRDVTSFESQISPCKKW